MQSRMRRGGRRRAALGGRQQEGGGGHFEGSSFYSFFARGASSRRSLRRKLEAAAGRQRANCGGNEGALAHSIKLAALSSTILIPPNRAAVWHPGRRQGALWCSVNKAL